MNKNYKKIMSLIVACAVAVTAAPIFELPSARVVNAAETSASDTSTVSYDLNRDGSKDQITFQTVRTDAASTESPYSDFNVQVNGRATSLNISEAWYYTYAYEFFNMGSKTFLFVDLTGDNDDGAKRIYSWEGSDFALQVDLNDEYKEYKGVCYHLTAEVGKVRGIRLVMNVRAQFTGLPMTDLKREYLLRRGKLKPLHQTSRVVRYHAVSEDEGSGARYLTASRKIITYRTKKCKKRSVKWIKSQSRVRVSRIYIGKGYTSYYVKGRGWYKVKNDVFKAEKLFSGVYYVG